MQRQVRFARKHINPTHPLTLERIYHVIDENVGSIQVCDDNNKCSWYPASYFSTVEQKPNRPPLVPHKHAAIIKAWADGATIQYLRKANNKWYPVMFGAPCWCANDEYRVKPDLDDDAIERVQAQLTATNRGLDTLNVQLKRTDERITKKLQYRSDLIIKLDQLERGE